MRKLSSFSFVPLFASILFLFLSGFVFDPDNGGSYPDSKIIINKNGFSDGFRTMTQSPAANTLLINPTGDGGFENGSTFSENGWTVINDPNPLKNPFTLGTLPVQYAGSRCAYTWDGENTTDWECRNLRSISHIYKDFTIPEGDNTLDLSFYYKIRWINTAVHNSSLRIYIIPVSITPVAGELLTIDYRIGGPYDATNNYWANDRIILSGKSGTLRLVFSTMIQWENNYTGPQEPVALDNIKLISKGPLIGSKTIQPGGDFETFKDAVDELNLVGVGSGGVTFNVQAGQTFNTTIPTSVQSVYSIASIGSLANPIVFQKSGSGANPKLNIKGHSNGAKGISLSGANYMTFDGIDINDDGSSEADWVDFGFYIYSSSNITVKNCTIDLSRHNVQSIGVKSQGAETGNNNNKFYNNTIQDAFNGYYFSSGVVYDQNNEIGTDGIRGTSIIRDIGSYNTDDVPVYFVYCSHQKGFKLFNTSMDNINVPETYRNLYGFYCGPGNESTTEIYNSEIKNLTTTQIGAYGTATGIKITAGAQHSIRNNTINGLNSLLRAEGMTLNASDAVINILNNKIYNVYNGIYSKGLVVEKVNTANIYNNFIYDIKSEGNVLLGAIGLEISGGTSVNAFYNTVFLNNASSNASKESAALKIGGIFSVGVNTVDLRNNIFVNLTNVTNGTRAVAHYRTGDGTVNYSNTNNNLYYTGATGPKNLIYYAKTISYEFSDRTLKDYKTRIATVDQNAVWEYPPFISTTGTMDLHLNSSTATQCESGGQRITSPIAITNDYDADIRFGETGYGGTGSAPDIGADEINGIKDSNPPLIGDYTVGADGSFSTISAAITKLNQSGVGGPIRFLLTDNSYYILPPIVIDIIRSSLPNADNPVTIKPNTGVSPSIYTSNPGQTMFKLNGSDFIIIDGSNTTNGITKDLTLYGNGSSAIWMCSKSSSNGATNNIVKNCIIKKTDMGGSLSYGVILGSGTSTTGSAEFPNSNITIQSNTITGVSNTAVFQNGYPNTPYDQNITITGNIFGSDLSKLGQRGLMLQNIDTFTVSENTISGIFSSYTTNTLSGIEIGGKNLNGSIFRNSINDVKNTNPDGYAATAIYLNSTSSNSNTVIYNNIIYDIAGYGEQNIQNQRNGYGILINSGGGYNIYYNSINLASNQTNINGYQACLFVSSNAALSGLDIRNNIFSIPATVGNTYAVICVPGNGVFSLLNNNDYFYSGTNLGYINGANITDLNAWKTATGKDANSISSDPLFVSNSDLHINPNQISPVIGAATQIAGITTDFDGVSRDIPEIGAYEWISSVLPPAVFSSSLSSNTQIDLNFTPNASNNNVIIVWNLSGTFTDPGGTPPAIGGSFAGGTLLYNGTTSPQNHSGLLALTTYYYKAFSYNGSLYSSGLTANARTVNNLPYFQSFDGDFPPYLWTLATTYGLGDNWSKNTEPGNPYSGTGVMSYFAGFDPAQPWAFTPGFYFISGSEYRISFWQKTGSQNKNEKLKVTYGNAQNVASQINTIWFNNYLQNTNYEYRTADFPCTSSGIYYFAFNCYSAGQQDWIFVDNVEIKLKPLASDSQLVSGTSLIAFTGTGATLQYTEAPGSQFTLNMDRVSSSPGGTPPGTLLNVANQYWAATVTSGTASGTYCITLDLTGVEGISQPLTLHLLKRDNAGTNWVDLGMPSEVIPGPPLLVKYCGLTGFSEFGLGGGIDNPLPVQLSSFTSNLDGRNVILKWKTNSEINNSGFEIERRINEIGEWTKLSFINGAGNSNSLKSYSFTDCKLETGKYNYRLKQIDFNGNYTYYTLSSSVDVGVPQKYSISQNYPNPFNPTTKIDYDLPFDSKVLITIYDITGREIKRLMNNEVKQAGYHTLVFNGGNISSGVYFYRMAAEGNGQNYVMTKKMILVR